MSIVYITGYEIYVYENEKVHEHIRPSEYLEDLEFDGDDCESDEREQNIASSADVYQRPPRTTTLPPEAKFLDDRAHSTVPGNITTSDSPPAANDSTRATSSPPPAARAFITPHVVADISTADPRLPTSQAVEGLLNHITHDLQPPDSIQQSQSEGEQVELLKQKSRRRPKHDCAYYVVTITWRARAPITDAERASVEDV